MRRTEFIKKYVAGKSILNIGCVDSSGEEYLHGFLAGIANHLEGCDINKKGLDAMRINGYDVFYGDAEGTEGFDNGKEYDVIIAGEVIEHLFNMGNFLENTRNALKNEGMLIITTPNARSLTYHFNRILGRINVMGEHENAEHVHLYTAQTLIQLLGSNGFSAMEIVHLDFYHYSWKKFPLKIIYHCFPDFSEGIMLVARRKV